MDSTGRRTTGSELLHDVVALDLKTVGTKIDSGVDPEIVHLKMTLKDDPEVLELVRLGLIFAIGVMSFADARPRGISDMDFVVHNEWQVGDMLRGLRFQNGRLHFYADYVRGRCMKMSIDIDKDGKIVVEAVNQREALTRWICPLK